MKKLWLNRPRHRRLVVLGTSRTTGPTGDSGEGVWRNALCKKSKVLDQNMRQQLERTREKLIRSKNCLASTVCYQCCCSSYDWSAQIRPRHAVAEGLALATCTWTHNVQVVRSCLQLSPRYGAALPTRCYPACRCNLAPSSSSSSSSALVVPVTRRTTIGDRAFAVAGPRARNSLPQFVTDCPSPGTFRKYLKTYLFSLSL